MKTKDPEILKLQKQVDKLLEEYRQEQIPKYKEPEGEPSYNMAENVRHWQTSTTGEKNYTSSRRKKTLKNNANAVHPFGDA